MNPVYSKSPALHVYLANIMALGLRNELGKPKQPGVRWKIDSDSNKNPPNQGQFKLPLCWVTWVIPDFVTFSLDLRGAFEII